MRDYRSGFCPTDASPGNEWHSPCRGGHDANPTKTWRPCVCTCHQPALDTPTGVLVTNAAPETEEWFAARRGGITGTDLPKILGMSKYGNALSVWLDKRGEYLDEAGEAAMWGHVLEEPVAQEWARRTGATIAPIGVLAHHVDQWMRASLDRLVPHCPEGDIRACGLEIKTRSAFKADEWRDGMPDSVLAQVAWGRRVSGLHHMHVAALIGGQRLVTHRYDRDDVLEGYLLDAARPVWECVQDGTPPEVHPDADGVLLDLLDRLYSDRAGIVDLDPDQAEKWLAQYADGGDLEKQGKALKAEAKSALVQLLGPGEIGCVNDVPRLTYRPDPAGDTVTADNLRAYKTADPDRYDTLRDEGLITTTNPRPTFRLKPVKRKKTAA